MQHVLLFVHTIIVASKRSNDE